MKIVLVDDHLMFAQVLAKICRDEGHSIAAVEGWARLGIRAVEAHGPEMLVVDLVLPEMDGFSLIKACRHVSPGIKVLVVSCRLDQNTAYKIEQLRCQGFVAKMAGFAEFRTALREIAAGRLYFSRDCCDLRTELWNTPNAFPKVLSDWQQIVISDVGSLKSDSEIARKHGVTEAAIVKLKQRAARKLGLNSVNDLIACARRLGLYAYSP